MEKFREETFLFLRTTFPIATALEKKRTGEGEKTTSTHGLQPPLDVLGHPEETIAVSLLHNDGAHEHLNGAHILQWDLALASSLDQSEVGAELLLRDSAGGVNLVSENEEGHTLQLLDGKESLRTKRQNIMCK